MQLLFEIHDYYPSKRNHQYNRAINSNMCNEWWIFYIHGWALFTHEYHKFIIWNHTFLGDDCQWHFDSRSHFRAKSFSHPRAEKATLITVGHFHLILILGVSMINDDSIPIGIHWNLHPVWPFHRKVPHRVFAVVILQSVMAVSPTTSWPCHDGHVSPGSEKIDRFRDRGDRGGNRPTDFKRG